MQLPPLSSITDEELWWLKDASRGFKTLRLRRRVGDWNIPVAAAARGSDLQFESSFFASFCPKMLRYATFWMLG